MLLLMHCSDFASVPDMIDYYHRNVMEIEGKQCISLKFALCPDGTVLALGGAA